MSSVGEWFAAKRLTLRDDIYAGFILAILALPLALGYAIASGVDPLMGVYASIIGGIVAALFGGSEFQVSGPTGGMAVVVMSVVASHGVSGLVVAVLLAGAALIIAGICRLGKIIEYIPAPIVVGYSAGIGVIIFFGQVNNAFGISPAYPAGATFVERTLISLGHAAQANIGAVILALIALAILIVMPYLSKRVPASIAAVAAVTGLSILFAGFFDVVTIGDVADITALPDLSMPALSWGLIMTVLPAALTLAALIAIESLLTATIADSMTDTRHNPNRELIGQGIANICCALFGTMPSGGSPSRTTTNATLAKTRMSSVFHGLILLAFVLGIGIFIEYVPLAALAAILMYVAFNMVNWERIRLLFKTPLSDVAVMITTFLLTVLVNLTVAIEVGLILASILFMKRMSDLYNIKIEGTKDGTGSDKIVEGFEHPDISIITVQGPLFFGAATRFDQQVALAPNNHKPVLILRMKHVPVIDATGLSFLSSMVRKQQKKGVIYFSAVHPDVMRIIRKAGMEEAFGKESFFPNTRMALAAALRHSHRLRGQPEELLPDELGKYSLSTFDLEEAHPDTATRDKDPVEDILDSVGVTYLADFGQKTIRGTMRTIEPISKTLTETGKTLSEPIGKTIRGTKKLTKKVLGDKDAMLKGADAKKKQ